MFGSLCMFECVYVVVLSMCICICIMYNCIFVFYVWSPVQLTFSKGDYIFHFSIGLVFFLHFSPFNSVAIVTLLFADIHPLFEKGLFFPCALNTFASIQKPEAHFIFTNNISLLSVYTLYAKHFVFSFSFLHYLFFSLVVSFCSDAFVIWNLILFEKLIRERLYTYLWLVNIMSKCLCILWYEIYFPLMGAW